MFHHYFLVQLIKLLGVTPNLGKQIDTEVLHIQDGIFEYNSQPNKEYFSLETSLAFKQILGTKIDKLPALKLTKNAKKNLTRKLSQLY